MADRTFADLGKVEAIRSLYEGTPFKAFADPSFGMADRESTVSRSRLMLEGTDFDLVYFPLKHLGYKAVTTVTGELYAAMARPKAIEMTLGISAKLDYPQVRQLWEGAVAAASEHGYSTFGLDLIPSRNGLAISVSAAGSVSANVARERKAPASKDLLCVSGRLGAAYLGQQLLESEKERFEGDGSPASDRLEKNRMLVGAYLKPDLPARVPSLLEDSGIFPTAGRFLTHGLADALLSLGRDTGLGVKVYADKIPFEGNSFALGKELDIDPVSAAMNGGEDCQLLFAIPILQMEEFRRNFQTFDIIGHLALPEAGTCLVLPTGAEIPVTAQGWK